MKKKLLIFICILSYAAAASASADTLGRNLKLDISRLKPGMRQYLVIMQQPAAKKKLAFWYWQRRLSLGSHLGKPTIVIDQQWFSSDSSGYRAVRSVNRATDFQPVFHSEAGGGKMRAVNWSEREIRGADTVAGNASKDLAITLNAPAWNWNLDLETFEMLPLAAGKTFVINFLDIGQDAPKLATYQVVGSENIRTFDNRQVDCWVLRSVSEHNGREYTQSFWISKANHEFLKEEDEFGGMLRYKIKMPDTVPDIGKNFAK
ncbi:hypothetical protein C7T94_11105 [Pedobacter yulinensis]|uniref:Outer membrane lipoprotein-sorting protein n=1 Tax=Pedobacter yulinensis TaxID=2126353 RepID=A0A2T3HL58_9SPHI|nr:hypothetical protein [Pedobacter yulinensis]PST83143.1 hypothetical protein C7T94_11105 [Pedobacter yulinensis]